MMTGNESTEPFIAIDQYQPQKNGNYEVIVRTASIYQGGTFLTRLDFSGGKWITPNGYCPLQVLAWKEPPAVPERRK